MATKTRLQVMQGGKQVFLDKLFGDRHQAYIRIASKTEKNLEKECEKRMDSPPAADRREDPSSLWNAERERRSSSHAEVESDDEEVLEAISVNSKYMLASTT